MSTLKKENLDEHLIHFDVANNSYFHTATSYSPFLLNYTQDIRTKPLEALETKNAADSFPKNLQESTKQAILHITKANAAMANYTNKRRSTALFTLSNKAILSTTNLILEDESGN